MRVHVSSPYINTDSVHNEDLHSYPLWEGNKGVEIEVNGGIGWLNLPYGQPHIA